MYLVNRNRFDLPGFRFWSNPTQWNEDSVVWSPRVDIEENEEGYILHADIPGMDKKDISLTVEDNVLTIKGKREYENKKEDKNEFFLERAFGNFKRSFKLPQRVAKEKIKADYNNGVLTVTVPKAEETKPKLIEIQ